MASLHRIKAQIKPDNCEIIAEVHAFFEFKDGMLVSYDERTRIVQGATE